MKFIQKLDIFLYSVCKYNGADYNKANAIWGLLCKINIVISSVSKQISGIILEETSDHLPVFFLTGEVEITKRSNLL